MAKFQLEFVLRETSGRAMKAALKKLPSNMSDAYKLIMQHINDTTTFGIELVVLLVLSWIYHAK